MSARKLDANFFRDANLIGALAYVLGIVSGLIVLAFDKRDSPRFHAMQSIIFFLAVLVVFFVLSGIPVIGAITYVPLMIVTCVIWVSLMFTTLLGQRVKLPYIGDLAERQLTKDSMRP
jgi:uncharacterized membrane protein